MQVKMMGFKLEGDPNFSLEGMLSKFRAFGEKKYKSHTLYLRLSNNPTDGFLKGLVMYSTHNKTEHELVGKEIRKVDIINNRIRANYFVINTTTFEGIFQSYFGSTSPKEFGNLLNWQYSISKRESRPKDYVGTKEEKRKCQEAAQK